jgi:hypothetical protein
LWSFAVAGLSGTAYASKPALPDIDNQPGKHQQYFVDPEHFAASPGTWTLPNYSGSFRGQVVFGKKDMIPATNLEATAVVDIERTDIYYVWAHTRDFSASPGKRHFKVALAGVELPLSLGVHGTEGWKWELAGKAKLDSGQLPLSLRDTSAYYARVDGIVLTTDPYYIPNEDYASLKQELEEQRSRETVHEWPDLPDIVPVEGYYDHHFFVPEQFQPVVGGAWEAQSAPGAYRLMQLAATEAGAVAGGSVPAVVYAPVAVPGYYSLWVHSYDEPGAAPERGFTVQVQGAGGAGNDAGAALGHHGEGWAWEYGGTVKLPSGQAYLGLIREAGTEPLVDGVLLTADRHYVPSADYATLKQELALSRPVQPEPSRNILLRPESFGDLGTWKPQSYRDSFGALNLIGLMTSESSVFDPSTASPAVARFPAEEAGEYRVWVRSRDFAVNPGVRYFSVEVNGQLLPASFGTHGADAWAWEDGGVVELAEGENTLSLVDASGFFARTDAILLTTDLSAAPPASYEETLKLSRPEYAYTDRLAYPASELDGASVTQAVYTLENAHMRLRFQADSTAAGAVVRQESWLKQGEEELAVQTLEDEFGYLLLYSQTGKFAGQSEQTPIFDTTVPAVGGQPASRIATVNAFHGGLPGWLIPSSVQQLDGQTVLLRGENEYAVLEAQWELPTDAEEPLVTLRLEPKQAGAFSLGIFNGRETPLEEVEFLLNPFRYHSKRMPVEPVLVTEQTSSNAASYMTLPGGTGWPEGQQVTYAVSVDPSSVNSGWTYAANASFGLGIMGRDGGVQPSLFAPLMGGAGSVMDTEDSFRFAYRPVVRAEGWYETYSHVTKEIQGLADYRENVEASLTDTIFHVQELLLDDEYGGWDPQMKGYYNMEAQNVVTTAHPLSLIQAYLLSGEDELYERRVLPTMENLLTRQKMHYTSTGNSHSYPDPLPIGAPVAGYGTSVFGAVYEMAGGLAPVFREIGIDGGVRPSTEVPAWSEQLWMYRYTGDTAYLNAAKAGADRYLAEKVDAPSTALPPFSRFIYISYYANFNALLDLYEISGESRYLQGAAEAARWLMTTIRAFPVPDGNVTVYGDDIRSRLFLPNANFWWKGEVQDRLGYPEGLAQLQDETVAAWIPSPVGLGLEQGSTFMSTDSGYITMSYWAPDLMRLSRLTGDPDYAMYARNAILGRGGSYPGYYQNQNMVHQKRVDYPYTGPDLTSIYYHHIPVYYGLLTDFLFAQAWSWSDGRVDFPSLRQQGYAYFSGRVYGHEPGVFFGQSGMWPWLEEGLLTVDHLQVDWLAARKDGVLGVALMNESGEAATVTVELGQALGGAALNVTAAVYDSQGAGTVGQVVQGKITVTIPGRGLVGLVLEHPQVAAPAYAASASLNQASVASEQTTAAPSGPGDFGYGAVLQLEPGFYHAYVYTTDLPQEADRVKLHYRIGDGSWQEQVLAQYPFEATVRVDSAADPFTFFLEALKAGSPDRVSSVKELRPLTADAMP